jgi:protoporphyrinogen oxidase
MRSHKTPPVAIVGGGIAGLTAARALRERGVPVRIFEAGAELAGLARTFQDEQGFSYDFGAHFVTNRLAAALNMGAACRTVPRYGEVVRVRGRYHAYPLGLLTNPRHDLSAAAARLRGLFDQAPARDAAEAFRREYGQAFADEIALPLVEAWAGAPADRLAPSVLQKLPGSILRTLAMRAAGRLTKRAVAIGYCREQPESPHVWHVYPEGGMGALCARLAEGLEDTVSLRSRVEKIYVVDGRAVGLRVNGEDLDAAAVVSTAPIHVLPKLVEGTDALAPLAAFRFRAMTFCNLNLNGRGLLPDVVVWLPERGFRTFRVTEATQSMPWLAPEGKTTLTIDVGCRAGDDWWQLSDDAVIDRCLDDVRALVPDVRERFLGGHVLRTPIAYPVFLREYEGARRRLAAEGTGVAGLLSIGRNGEFDHLLMEDVYYRTVDRVRRLAEELRRVPARPAPAAKTARRNVRRAPAAARAVPRTVS